MPTRETTDIDPRVPALTRACPETTCRIELQATREDVSGHLVFDRNGRVIAGAPTRSTRDYFCRTCGIAWQVVSRPGRRDRIDRRA